MEFGEWLFYNVIIVTFPGGFVKENKDPLIPVTSDVFQAIAGKLWGHNQARDLMTTEGKAMAASRIMGRTIVKDSLLLCDANWPLMFSWSTLDPLGDSSLESRIFSAVTDIDTG